MCKKILKNCLINLEKMALMVEASMITSLPAPRLFLHLPITCLQQNISVSLLMEKIILENCALKPVSQCLQLLSSQLIKHLVESIRKLCTQKIKKSVQIWGERGPLPSPFCRQSFPCPHHPAIVEH